MGRSWAALFARAGLEVRLYDVLETQLAAALEDVARDKVATLARFGLLWRGESAEQVVARVRTVRSLEDALRDAVYAQDCVPEDAALKQRVFAELDRVAAALPNARVVFGSSTSNIPASAFTANLACRDRCLVAHPVNPPLAVPVVELVRSPFTSDATAAFARALMSEIGMAPIVLKREVDGFVVNRLQYALLSEAFRLVEDGVCEPQDVDAAVSEGLGLRWSFMGPFQTIDLNAPGGVEDYCTRYAASIHRVARSQDNTREWAPETVRRVDAAMRAQVPRERLAERLAWRNQRLLALALHKQQQDKKQQD